MPSIFRAHVIQSRNIYILEGIVMLQSFQLRTLGLLCWRLASPFLRPPGLGLLGCKPWRRQISPQPIPPECSRVEGLAAARLLITPPTDNLLQGVRGNWNSDCAVAQQVMLRREHADKLCSFEGGMALHLSAGFDASRFVGRG